MIRMGIVIFFVSVTTANGYAQVTGNTWNLRQCVETGLKNNLDVLQTDLQAQTDKIYWKQSKMNMFPNLNGSATTGANRGRSIDPATNSYINQEVNYASYGLSSGVILFNGFSLKNTARQNQLAYEASKMDWQQAKDNLTINIILAYLLVLNNEDLLVQTRNQASLSQKQTERLEVLNRQGAIAPSMYSDLRGQYAGDQLALINTENAVESAKLNLARLMNVPYDRNMKLEKISAETYVTVYTDTPDKIYQEALQKFSLVKGVELRRQSASVGVKAARGRLFPVLSLNGGINTNYSSAARSDIFINTTDVTSSDYVLVNGNPSPVIYKQNNFTTRKIRYGSQLNNNLSSSVNLSLSIPIFNRFQERNRVKLAGIVLKSSEVQAITTKTQLQQSIEQAYINMKSAADRYKILLEQVAAFTESFRAAEARFNAGVGNSIDYLTAKNNLDRASNNLVNAQYDFVLRVKVLDYYQGKSLW
jgi:outer membrane protein